MCGTKASSLLITGVRHQSTAASRETFSSSVSFARRLVSSLVCCAAMLAAYTPVRAFKVGCKNETHELESDVYECVNWPLKAKHSSKICFDTFFWTLIIRYRSLEDIDGEELSRQMLHMIGSVPNPSEAAPKHRCSCKVIGYWLTPASPLILSHNASCIKEPVLG